MTGGISSNEMPPVRLAPSAFSAAVLARKRGGIVPKSWKSVKARMTGILSRLGGLTGQPFAVAIPLLTGTLVPLSCFKSQR